MLILLSPSKNLDFAPAPNAPPPTRPVFLKDAAFLADAARGLGPARLKRLMGVSDKLAALNHERFEAFRGDFKSNAQKPAALAFSGDVYLGLGARTMRADDFAFAQTHLRILSGLYGILRPLDAIEPYRLEMGLKFKTARGADLYAFWGGRIAEEINKALRGHADRTIVNLASAEYFDAVDRTVLGAPVVTPVFREEKDGRLRSLQFFAKRARGAMARWIIDERIESAGDLARFDRDGYRRRGGDAAKGEILFARPQPAAKAA
jgi:cytoplasmic iron level regulating protein YaaA (DUF328/UPF0246 family)